MNWLISLGVVVAGAIAQSPQVQQFFVSHSKTTAAVGAVAALTLHLLPSPIKK